MKKIVISALMAFGSMVSFNGSVHAQEGNATAGEDKITVCLACHGTSGNDNLLPGVPSIGGQHQAYLLKQMIEIKDGSREIALMTGMLNTLNEQDMADVAAYYAAQPAPLGAATEESIAVGAKLYRSGDASIGVAACSACHSPAGNGNAGAGYPALMGQDPAYIEVQLRAFRSGSRQNDATGEMRSITARLNDSEISALASYVSGLRGL